MKYKLLKDLPLAKAGTVVEISDTNFFQRGELDIHLPDDNWRPHCIANITLENQKEWLEEVKEPKTIYDLKKGDKYYEVYANLQINSNIYNWHSQVTFNMFLTEREAKRNKLLRELATRTSKHLPKKWENYIWTTWISRIWQDLDYQILDYNIGLVFYGDDDYNSFMTDENKKLLFEI